VTSPILLISGPVGAGKTTVAKLVAEQWGAPVAYLEGDRFWPCFVRHAPAANKLEARRRDSKILVQALIASSVRFARGGYDVVAEFTIGPWALDAISAAVKDIPLDYVVISPSLATCASRIAERDGTDYEHYAELHAAFGKLGRYEAHAIRDDRAEPGEIAARILAGLAGGDYRIGT
jgi:cytidylate kinase